MASLDDVCVVCRSVQSNKIYSTLMCSFGHATCFTCVAAGVQPHALCGNACNGFKYKCAQCSIWLCINRTQELALMCGGHALARSRLREASIEPQAFLSPCAYHSSSDESEDGDTYASNACHFCPSSPNCASNLTRKLLRLLF